MYQLSITSRFIERKISSIKVDHANQILLSLLCFCPQCLMNTQFHATVRAVNIIEMRDTRNLWTKHAARPARRPAT